MYSTWLPRLVTQLTKIGPRNPRPRYVATGQEGVSRYLLTVSFATNKISVDYASVGTPYEAAEHKGPLPTAEIDGGKLYTGGCHCGAVTVAVVSPLLDGSNDEKGLECNCSICVRVFPPRLFAAYKSHSTDIIVFLERLRLDIPQKQPSRPPRRRPGQHRPLQLLHKHVPQDILQNLRRQRDQREKQGHH